MSRTDESPVRLANYSLEKWIEDENRSYADGTEFVWQYDQRMKIVEPMIRDTARFGVDLIQQSKVPSSFDEGYIVLECIDGSYDIAKAKCWIFLDLYTNAIHQANAIYVLYSTSHISQGFQLWRSLFETHIICEFLSRNKINPQLLRDYISHTLLRSWIRMKKGVNSLCVDREEEPKYDMSQIAECKKIYESKGWKLNEDYAWANSSMNKNRVTFRDIMNQVDSDMAIFYRVSSMEIHPTLGQRFAYLNLNLPLPAVPMSLLGVHGTEELQLDFVTAKVLHSVTCRTDTFVSLDDNMKERFEKLRSRGKNVLEERKRARPPIK